MTHPEREERCCEKCLNRALSESAHEFCPCHSPAEEVQEKVIKTRDDLDAAGLEIEGGEIRLKPVQESREEECARCGNTRKKHQSYDFNANGTWSGTPPCGNLSMFVSQKESREGDSWEEEFPLNTFSGETKRQIADFIRAKKAEWEESVTAVETILRFDHVNQARALALQQAASLVRGMKNVHGATSYNAYYEDAAREIEGRI